jgi:hypothetical protein
MSSDLTLDTTLARNPRLIAADMDGDTVMMNIESGEYFGLGGVGTRVWELLAAPHTLAQLVQTICTEYEVDATTCEADVRRFLGDLLKNGLAVRA